MSLTKLPGFTLDATTNFTFSNISVTTSANLGNVSNIKISGGTTGQFLKTDGYGNLSWATGSGGGGGSTSVTVSSSAPSGATEGSLWLDSESGELSVYFGGAWASTTAGAGQLDCHLDSYTGDGTTAQYVLSTTPAGSSYTMISIAGVVQPKTSYAINGNVLTFSSAPPATAPVEVTTFGGSASAIGLAGSVTSAAQPNVTSLGTLISLNVAGTSNLGPAGNILISGGANGQVLTSNGSSGVAWTWAVANQSGNTGKYLTTDGSTTSWSSITGLPTQTNNAGKFLQTDGNSASWVSYLAPLATPILSGLNTGLEVTVLTVTITNYNATYAYIVSVTGGSYTQSGSTISWTLPAVSATTVHYINVQSTYSGQSSFQGTLSATVVDIPVPGDAAIVVTDFSVNSFNNGWLV